MFSCIVLVVAALALTACAERSVPLSLTLVLTHTWAHDTTKPIVPITRGFNLPWNMTRPSGFMLTGYPNSITPLPADNITQSLNSISSLLAARLTVTVGEGGNLAFAPSSLNLSIGSIIAFNFLGLNYTLTESSLRNPCERNGGFDTKFRQFNPTNTSGKFIVEYEVVDRNPRWFFCVQTRLRPYCQAGMVFSLNL
jgi:hypothetical protein